MFFKMRSAYFVAAISTVLTVAAVASAKYKAQDPKIQVHAKGPAGMSIDGVSNTLKIEQDDKFYKFKTYLNTIDTKNGKHVHATFGFDVTKHGVKEEDLCFEPKTKSICAKTRVDVEVDFDLKEVD